MKLDFLKGIFFPKVALCIASFTVLSGDSYAQLLGAELYAAMIQPGQCKLTLRTFYQSSEAQVPNTEKASLLASKNHRLNKILELAKQNEFIETRYAMIESTPTSSPTLVKTVVYSSLVMLENPTAGYDITWAYSGISELLNNAVLERGQAIALIVHVSDSLAAYNSIPILDRLPTVKLSSNSVLSSPLSITDNDLVDQVDVTLSAPVFMDSTGSDRFQVGSILTDDKPLKKVQYRKGFSPEALAAKYILFNKETREFNFNHTPFGRYLVGITIADHRGGIQLSQHQAFFIVESTL